MADLTVNSLSITERNVYPLEQGVGIITAPTSEIRPGPYFAADAYFACGDLSVTWPSGDALAIDFSQ